MPPARSTCLPRTLALLLFAAVAAPLRAESPRDELLRHVPDDVGFCLIVTDVRATSAALADSPFAEQFRASPAGQALANSQELKDLAKADATFRALLGIGWDDLRDDILGDAFVFAYRPGPPGKEKEEQELLLIRARDGKKLADLVERLNKLQMGSGELLRLEEREYGKFKYVCRVEKDRDKEKRTFYHLRGPVLLFTSQEEMLKRSLDQAARLPETAPPPLATRLRKLGGDGALFALWVNPRAFDADIAAKRQADPQDAGLRAFESYWKALDGILFAVRLERDFSLNLAVEARPAALPPAARRFLAAAAQPSEMWRFFPDDALFAAGGRIDGAALLEALGEFLPPERRDALHADLNRTFGAPLGKDFVKEVLPFVGPDWGVCVVAPPANNPNWFPQGVLAVRVAPGNKAPPVDEELLKAISSLAQVAVFAHNQAHPTTPLSLKTVEVNKRSVKYLDGEGVFPPGLQPAFALVDGRLLLASSPEVIRGFGAAPAPPPQAGSPVPLVRVSAKAWRDFLRLRRKDVVAFLADKNQLPAVEVGDRLDKVLAVLDFIDRVELRQKTDAGQVILSLTVTPTKPLRK
jgi:hypothetical protein